MPADYAVLGLFSIALQIGYLFILPISFEGDAGGYFLHALFLAGDPRGAFQYYRPPGYPFFMAATGLTWLQRFDLAIAVQAAMGAAIPLLAFGALRQLGRTTALSAAFLLALSGVPYSFAKLFTTEHVYMFCVMTTVFGVARFIADERPALKFAVVAIGGAVAALMVRNEAVYLALLSFFVLLAAAWPARRLLASVALAGSVALALVMAWSVERAVIMGDPTAVGSLNNFSGFQMFWRVYYMSGREVQRWRCVVDPSAHPSCASPSAQAVLFSPENGPATRRMFAMVRDWAVRSGYEPARFLADFVSDPSDGTDGRPVDKRAVATNEALRLYGYAQSDEFMMRVVIEAIRAHPEIVYAMAAGAGDWFGVSFEGLVHDLRTPGDFVLPVFANWGVDAYEVMGMNVAGVPRETMSPKLWRMIDAYEPMTKGIAVVARQTMTPELWQAYQDANAKPMVALDWELLTLGRGAHNIVRNAAGLVLLLTWPALFFARRRLLAFHLAACLALYLGAYTAAFGYYMRFEHLILSLMVLVSAVSLDTVVRWLWGRLPHRGGRRTD